VLNAIDGLESIGDKKKIITDYLSLLPVQTVIE
jgi:hypothetical protein